ncbi:hypothetical protein EXIGLDRAFT_754630 [Exidia glandulosa HHB12029]|uniref:Ricin B lectin domain-containing protein n=1 Tax=Exidia glandulosa HHB12029 TaxID=1314781 RepID=A0A165CS60_EXIGL|nr:hypothetical protein EXIGLDRAFT_754630 [Exidia glandulosa HHB12029]
MRFISICFVVLAALASVRSVSFTNSGVYTITIAGRALTHANKTAPITAETLSAGATNQAWSIVVNPTSSSATIQNIATLLFVSSDGASGLVGSAAASSWALLQSTGQNIGSLCITLTSPNNTTLSVLQSSIPGGPSQAFDANTTLPPRGPYQILNQASNKIFGNAFVPGPTFTHVFPANDRTQIWFVIPLSNATIALNNFDSGGWLSVASGNGTNAGAVGAFDFSSQAPWTVAFKQGFGQTLSPAKGGFLTMGANVTISSIVDQKIHEPAYTRISLQIEDL